MPKEGKIFSNLKEWVINPQIIQCRGETEICIHSVVCFTLDSTEFSPLLELLSFSQDFSFALAAGT